MPSYFKKVFLSIFCNITPSKSCKTTLKPEIHHAFDVLQLDKTTLPTLQAGFSSALFIEWKEEPKWLSSREV